MRLTRKVRILLFIVSFIPGVKMDIVDLSTVSPDDANRARFLDELCERLGLEFATYALRDPFSGRVLGHSNYPDAWRTHYIEHRLHRFDPTLSRAARSIAPVLWERMSTEDGFAPVFNAARDFGIPTTGVTIPVRGPFGECGLLSVARSGAREDWGRHLREIVGNLQVAAVHIHDNVMHHQTLAGIFSAPPLSSREREVLQWTAAGKTQQDIGDILAIATRTVEVHLRSARDKLGALTTPQAIGRAIRLGLIQAG